MTRKFLMITIYLIIGWQAKAEVLPMQTLRVLASDKSVASVAPKKMKNICMFEAGDVGKLKYKADTYEKAFSKVTDECFQRRTQLFVKTRNQQPDQDRQIQFAESCVNGIKCI